MTFWSLGLSLSFCLLLVQIHVLALENGPRKGIHLPLVRKEVRREGLQKRTGGNASIGVGDFLDV